MVKQTIDISGISRPCIESPWKYPALERISTPTGRHYNTNYGHAPSVTTILAHTADCKGIDAWRDWIGHDRADAIVRDSTNLGSLMHKHLEDWISGNTIPQHTNLIHTIAQNMAGRIIQETMPQITRVLACEARLHYQEIYAGTTDLIAYHQGQLTIIDFKNSRKLKKEQHLKDYWCQTAAYAEAHNWLFDTQITRGVLSICTRDLEHNEYVLEGNQFADARDQWWRRVEEYYSSLL